MVATKKLYRIVRQGRYNGGRGCDELHSSEVLYCGYDKDEARRVYHENKPRDSRNQSPGAHYHVTVAQSMACDD